MSAAMAAYDLSRRANPSFQSPAKVFAKMKSKVQKEATCGKEVFIASKDPLCEVRGKQEAAKRAANIWTHTELKENRRLGSYADEAQALTLSPISSPRKTFDYTCSDISSKPLDVTSPGGESMCGGTPGGRAVLQSTAVDHPLCLVSRDQTRVVDPGGFHVSSRTPVNLPPLQNYRKDDSEFVLLNKHKPLVASVHTPMRNRLRKRKWEQQEVRRPSGHTPGSKEDQSPAQEREAPALMEAYGHNNTPGRGVVKSADPCERLHQPMFSPPGSAVRKGCVVTLEKWPTMSPAKMFALMKERESKKEHQDALNSSRRELFGQGNHHQSRETPLSSAHAVGDVGNVSPRATPGRRDPVPGCGAASVGSRSVADGSEDAAMAAAPPQPQPALVEDPLVLNSPQISIPKMRGSVFKRSHWPSQKKFPVENVIYLKKWFLRKNHKGLFVDGIHREENIPWNSNIIVDRVSGSVLKTLSGRVYILVGKMRIDLAKDFPNWLLKKFLNGFPPNWKALYERFLSESRDGAERSQDRRGTGGKSDSEPSSVKHSAKKQRQNPFKTPEFRPPAASSSSCSATRMSRSGRVIKPPLEYWKGGRVVLDAQMNVTIHEGYDTSKSEISIIASPRTTQRPARVFLPSSEGRMASGLVSEGDAPVPAKRVGALRKREKAAIPSAVEVLSGSSPEQWCGRVTRSSQWRPGPTSERASHMDAAPQTQKKPRIPSANSPERPPAKGKTERPSSGDEPPRRKGRQSRRAHKGAKVQTPSPGHKPSSCKPAESSQGGRKASRERSAATRKKAGARTQPTGSNGAQTPPPAEPTLRPRLNSRKDPRKSSTARTPEPEGDEWTQAELLRLREAVACYPKHLPAYWAKVARMVGTRSAEECHRHHTSPGTAETPAKKPKSRGGEKASTAKAAAVAECPVISARAGTLKRKQQVRQFLEALPREDVDDAFSSAYMQHKRFEIPSLCPSDDQDFQLSELEPQTPVSSCFPEVKTPQCLHITPGMMGSPNTNNDDKYVYQLQKRMKKNQFDVRKSSPSSKRFTPTPSTKQPVKRIANTGNDAFVIWEMFPGNEEVLSESGEEEDFYFSDD
ncbi:mis18-binding protein 1 isoform 2-T2 [Menidia menidia]